MSGPNNSHAHFLATRHFGSLDGLRFLSITAVIWHHLPLWPELTDISVFFARGHVGVDFFFVLSGYLITTLLLREEMTQGRFSLRGFYWRRILRIVPIYFFVVSVATLYAIVLKGQEEKLGILPYYYLFLSNFLNTEHIGFLDPTWSLAVEEQYYLIWPALLLLVPRRFVIPLLLGLISINVLSASGAFALIGIHAIDIGALRLAIGGTTYAPILMGSLMAILLHNPAGFSILRPVTAFQAAPWFWLGALLIALATFPGALEGLPNLVVHSLMCLTLVSLVIREDNGMAPLLTLSPIARIGQISYGIYLYHLFALAIVTRGFEGLGLTGWGWVFFLYYGLSILIAEISFRTLEAWAMRYRRKGPGKVAVSPPQTTL